MREETERLVEALYEVDVLDYTKLNQIRSILMDHAERDAARWAEIHFSEFDPL